MDTNQFANNSEEPRIELNRESLVNLMETGGWANFLAILGFVFIGLLVIAALFIGSIMPSTMPDGNPMPFAGGFITFLYLLLALLYFFPVYYLFNFASQVRSGIRSRDPNRVASAISNLKSHYKFVGIFTICILAVYILALVIMMAFGFGSMMGNSVNT